jgi:DNA modification methylase
MTNWRSVPIGDVKPNPDNPRHIKDDKFKKLVQSIRDFPQMLALRPIVVNADLVVLGGNMRLKACQAAGLREVPIVQADELTPEQQREFIIKDNVGFGEWEWDTLANEWDAEQLAAWGLDLPEFDKAPADGLTDPDDVPDAPSQPVSVLGDLWLLGDHRVLCGDSTSVDAVERLMDGHKALLLHADPPYGMGKEADGVANDNLYADKLDEFQMEWWATFRPFITDNASVYIWGNAPDLWRLWYKAGLGTTEKMELRNEIVWDKKAVPGMASDGLTQYPMATERCLFFQLGMQFLGNINAEDFPEVWEPLRSYFESQAIAGGIKPPDIKRVCGVSMYSHWFTRSQYQLVPEKHYQALQSAYPGLFLRPWSDLKAEWDRFKGAGRHVINGILDNSRSYFDNAHDVMRDVWEFSRVTGNERHGHATPKPVEMMERVMRSSLPAGGLCVEPFGGSGATLIGAERSGRVCYTMELQPMYVDVIVKRWQDFTGKAAIHSVTGQTFDALSSSNERTANG